MFPHFRNFEKHPIRNEISFDIDNVSVEIVNSCRRGILSLIPNVGINFDPYNADISDIQFIENTSPLHNEFLGHRLSLLPVNLNEDEIETFDKNKYNFEIQVHNKTHEMIKVTSNDIRITDENGQLYPLEVHRKIFPVSQITGDPILIVALNPNHYNIDMGEKLHVKFQASIGKGMDHARFSPVSTCTYFNNIDKEKVEKAKKELIDKTQDVLSKKDANLMGSQDIEILKKRFDVHDAYRYFKTNEYGEPNSFRFIIESESGLSHKYIFSKVLDVLINTIDDLIKRKRFKLTGLGDNTFSILVKGEQHTLGNLIQGSFYNMFMRERPNVSQENEKDENNENMESLKFIGYHLVHPLMEELVFKIAFLNESHEEITLERVKNFFQYGLRKIQDNLRNVKENWEKDYETHFNDKSEKKGNKKEKSTKKLSSNKEEKSKKVKHVKKT